MQAYINAAFDTLREPLLILDEDLRVVQANRAFCRTFEVEPEEATGHLLYHLGNGQWDLPRLRELLEGILSESTTVEDFEVGHDFEHIGRRVMLLNARRLYHPGSDAEAILLAIEDVTERRAAARRLREGEERFRLIVENAKEYAIFMTDREGRILTWNAGAERILGWSEEEAVGQLARMIFTEEDRAAGAPERERAAAAAQGIAEDVRWHRRKDGSRFWANGVMTALRDDGKLRSFAKILRDNTAQKQHEEALEAANAELARSNRELEHFARTVAHEIRSPLTAVAVCFGVLRHKYGEMLDARMLHHIERAEGVVRSIGELVGEVLRFAGVGGQETPFERVDVGELVEEVTDGLATQIADSGATVTQAALPTVQGNPIQLRQLFQNLIANAIKYRGEEAPQVHISAEQTGTHWTFSVRDNGIGFDSEEAERIFEVFQRAHDPGKYAGTGIGLAYCKRIVEHHGGRIWAESAEGEGSVFYFTLQAQVQDGDEEAARRALTPAEDDA